MGKSNNRFCLESVVAVLERIQKENGNCNSSIQACQFGFRLRMLSPTAYHRSITLTERFFTFGYTWKFRATELFFGDLPVELRLIEQYDES